MMPRKIEITRGPWAISLFFFFFFFFFYTVRHLIPTSVLQFKGSLSVDVFVLKHFQKIHFSAHICSTPVSKINLNSYI